MLNLFWRGNVHDTEKNENREGRVETAVEHPMYLRICPLFLFISYGQVSAILDKNVEATSFVAVANVEKNFTRDLHVAIVSCFTVSTHHAVKAGLQ